MMEYTIVYAMSTFKLSEVVEAYLRTGWMVTGGVAVSGAPMFAGFYQAMLKITPEDLEDDPCGKA